jgi:hypothetical protein
MMKRLLAAILAAALLLTSVPTVSGDEAAEIPESPEPARRLGDVDGDGVLSYLDVVAIWNILVGRLRWADVCDDTRYAALITENSRETNRLSFSNSVIPIILRIELALFPDSEWRTYHLASLLADVWADDEIYHGTTTGLRGEICRERLAVLYSVESDIEAGGLATFSFSHTERRIGRVNAANQLDDESSFQLSPAISHSAHSPYLTHSNGDQAITFVDPEPVSAGTYVAYQRIPRDYVDTVTIEDFSVNPVIHEEGDIVWEYCTCDGCCPPCECHNCEDCGYRGGVFGFGRVLGGSRPSMQDALAILRYVVGLPSPITDFPNARIAANITNPGLGSPTVRDALAILRYIVGLPNEIDTRNIELASGFIFPLDRELVTQILPFEWRPWNNAMHQGIDIVMSRDGYGSDILAAADGVVTHAGLLGNLGNAVFIRHDNGLMTVYAHCSSRFVEAGDIVVRGQPIARLGGTSAIRGHLHFEVREAGVPIDPMTFFGHLRFG